MSDGRPRLRLIWGQSPLASVFWKGERRLRYLYKTEHRLIGWMAPDGRMFPPTVEPPSVEQTQALVVEPVYQDEDIGIPRWYIEQMMPSSILCAEWDKIRYDMNLERGELEDSLGPPPSTGDYEEAFYMVADHDACCPGNSFHPGCKGSYRDPNQGDIEYIRWLMKQLNDEPFRYTWEEVPPPEVVVQVLQDSKNAEIERRVKKNTETAYAIRNSIMSAKGSTLSGAVRPITVPDLGNIFKHAQKF